MFVCPQHRPSAGASSMPDDTGLALVEWWHSTSCQLPGEMNGAYREMGKRWSGTGESDTGREIERGWRRAGRRHAWTEHAGGGQSW